MVIGIDASRAYISDKTGTENYSYHLINALLRLPESKSHTFVLFTRLNPILPKALAGYSNIIIKVVEWKYLWTQAGLSWETWKKVVNPYSRRAVNQDSNQTDSLIHWFTGSRYLDVLWIPAHTLPVLRNPKIKTVVTIHGLEYQWLPEYKNLLQRWYLPLSTMYAAKQASQLIAVSEFTAKQLQKQLHTISKKIKVVHEGVDFGQSEYSAIQRVGKPENQLYQKFGITKKQYILFVGTVQPRKNLVALVEAFSHFASGYAGGTVSDYKLVIAGGIGWMAEEVLRAPARYGVQEKVIFTGRVSETELQSLYLGAKIYVQPSITEGFGLPVLEAMAQGVPVVSSDGGALREVVGNAGLIVQLNNQASNSNNQNSGGFVKNLAGAMKRVIEDKDLQKNLISMGYNRVKGFTWERAARETLGVLIG